MPSIFFSKKAIFLLIALSFVLHFSGLEAGGWGKTEKVSESEGSLWNEAYFDMNGIYLTASIPNYDGAQLRNNIVSIYGKENEAGYLIKTTFNEGFTPPNSQEGFLKLVQEANDVYQVVSIDAKKLGAKYAVDLIPKKPETTAFWRFLSTKDRLIQMGTDDPNENRRLHFFESIRIR